MSETWQVLLPEEVDPSGPESIADFAECTSMAEYGSCDAALADGVVGRAALDTFESEPPEPDHPLYDRDDVLLTPHVGGVTTQALARMSRRAAANVRTVYERDVPDSTRNAEALGVAA